jgi:hypothetical protein
MYLAGMARFVITDLSDPNTIPHELMSFAEKLLSVPVTAPVGDAVGEPKKLRFSSSNLEFRNGITVRFSEVRQQHPNLRENQSSVQRPLCHPLVHH